MEEQFPRFCERGPIEALNEGVGGTSSPQGFRASVSAAPLKPEILGFDPLEFSCFRASVSAAPLKHVVRVHGFSLPRGFRASVSAAPLKQFG